jgi:hypothetical protein
MNKLKLFSFIIAFFYSWQLRAQIDNLISYQINFIGSTQLMKQNTNQNSISKDFQFNQVGINNVLNFHLTNNISIGVYNLLSSGRNFSVYKDTIPNYLYKRSNFNEPIERQFETYSLTQSYGLSLYYKFFSNSKLKLFCGVRSGYSIYSPMYKIDIKDNRTESPEYFYDISPEMLKIDDNKKAAIGMIFPIQRRIVWDLEAGLEKIVTNVFSIKISCLLVDLKNDFDYFKINNITFENDNISEVIYQQAKVPNIFLNVGFNFRLVSNNKIFK